MTTKTLETARGLCRHGPAGTFSWEGGSRAGTVFAEYRDLVLALGKPTQYHPGDADDKVSYEWEIWTPRGVASIYDYWWSGNGHWSIGAKDKRVNRWVHRYLWALNCPVMRLGEDFAKHWRAAPFPRINRSKDAMRVDLLIWEKYQDAKDHAAQ